MEELNEVGELRKMLADFPVRETKCIKNNNHNFYAEA